MILDHDLVRKAQSGNMGAFTELVRRHDRSVLALVARYVNNAEDAKDIFQEVMIRVFRGLPAFQYRSEFSTWIHRITVNVCLNHKARSKAALHVPFNQPDGNQADGGTSVREMPSEDQGPDQAAIRSETWTHVSNALRALSPRERMVFSLRHYEAQSLKEIASTLRCTEGTVKRYLFTATRKMREQLQGLL